MRYICLGHLDVTQWAILSAGQQSALIDECFAYDEVLKKNGHWVIGEGLQGPDTATTLRHQNGKVSATDGPYIETKEILGGLLIIEARDRSHAIQLMSNHPGVKMGPWEIRPAEDLTELIRASERRRGTR